jgi:hypothetical protein
MMMGLRKKAFGYNIIGIRNWLRMNCLLCCLCVHFIISSEYTNRMWMSLGNAHFMYIYLTHLVFVKSNPIQSDRTQFIGRKWICILNVYMWKWTDTSLSSWVWHGSFHFALTCGPTRDTHTHTHDTCVCVCPSSKRVKVNSPGHFVKRSPSPTG